MKASRGIKLCILVGSGGSSHLISALRRQGLRVTCLDAAGWITAGGRLAPGVQPHAAWCLPCLLSPCLTPGFSTHSFLQKDCDSGITLLSLQITCFQSISKLLCKIELIFCHPLSLFFSFRSFTVSVFPLPVLWAFQETQSNVSKDFFALLAFCLWADINMVLEIGHLTFIAKCPFGQYL